MTYWSSLSLNRRFGDGLVVIVDLVACLLTGVVRQNFWHSDIRGCLPSQVLAEYTQEPAERLRVTRC